ncbi:MAG: T6SS phospholipase effector Tle1-like catalytic domain-containing protein [Flavobacterium sp.]
MENKKSTIRISLFFDGTGNNASNAEAREDDTIISPKTGGSYDISPTNIFRLYSNLKKRDDSNHQSIYIEGIGTLDGMDDSKTSAATGFDVWTGYDAASKTVKAYNSVINLVHNYNLTNANTTVKIIFDLFGFSRGAALARNFANILNIDQEKINHLKDVFSKAGNTLNGIEYGFIGLFDTVESMIYPPNAPHLNLCLNSIKSECTFHLSAMHECRENFPLTRVINLEDNNSKLYNCGSCCNINQKVFEMVVPGAHSDVGGGYNKSQDENATINTKAFYTAAGAKESVENIIKLNPLFAPLFNSIKYEFETFSAGYNAISRRKKVAGHIQLVYAKLMLETARQFGVRFDVNDFDKSHPIPEELLPYFNKLVNSKKLLFDGKTFSSINKDLSDALMAKYIHISVSTRTLLGQEDSVPTGPLLRSKLIKDGNVVIINRPAKDWKRKIY